VAQVRKCALVIATLTSSLACSKNPSSLRDDVCDKSKSSIEVAFRLVGDSTFAPTYWKGEMIGFSILKLDETSALAGAGAIVGDLYEAIDQYELRHAEDMSTLYCALGRREPTTFRVRRGSGDRIDAVWPPHNQR
jgi:hypothetical protein